MQNNALVAQKVNDKKNQKRKTDKVLQELGRVWLAQRKGRL